MPTITPSPSGFQFRPSKNVATPPGAGASILPLVVIGYCSDTTNAPVNTPLPISTPNAAKTAGSKGPAVELAACALDDNGQVKLVHLVNCDASNAASYGAITQTWANASPPTVIAEPNTLPDDDCDVDVFWTVGGTVGTAGAKYRVSIDNGLHYFAEQALGTATLITLPNGAGSYRLIAPLATLVARSADIRTKLLAHTAEFGTVHTIVDPNSPYTIPTPIDLPTLFTCCAALRTSALNHVDELATVHGAVDTAAQALITALTTPTTLYGAQTFLAAFAAAFFGDGATLNSGHTRRTTSAIHLVVDTVNILAAMGSLGVITANDTFSLSTLAPSPNATELVAAIDSLRSYTGQFGTIVFAAPIPASYVATIHAALKELWKRNLFPGLIASFDRPTFTETATQYAARLADLDGILCESMRMCSGAVYHQSALINTADGAATMRRPNSWWVSMARTRNEPQTNLQFVTPQRGVSIRDSSGSILPGCLDEQDGNLYSVLARTCGTKTDTNRDRNGGVFLTQDLVLYDLDSNYLLATFDDVVNHAFRTAAPVVVKASAAPNGFQGFGDEEQRNVIESVLSVIVPEMVDKGRCKEVRVSIVDTSGGFLSWKMVVVTNKYFINGAALEASVLVERTV